MILDRIIAHKRTEIESAKQRISYEDMRQRAEELQKAKPKSRRFQSALAKAPGVSLIAEVKKASPSKGLIRADFDPVHLAQAYVQGGAQAISILTDKEFFQGSLADFDAVRAVVDLPLLRKEFILDPYQLYEARVHGADAALLIVAALDARQLKDYIALTQLLGMDALVEIHTEEELEIALKAEARLIGINNRDLKTFETTLDVSRRLVPLIPDDITIVSESGISQAQDLIELGEIGVDAVLVGEALAREKDVVTAVKRLLGAVTSP